MITTLTFDLDDTLWSTRDVIGRAETELFDFMDAEFPVFTQHHSVESFAEVRQQLIQADSRRVHDLRQLRLDALRLEIARLGHPDPDPLANRASAHFQRARQAVRFWPGVLDTLETLARSYQLIALTNGTTDIMASPAGEFLLKGIGPINSMPVSPNPICLCTPCRNTTSARTKSCMSVTIGSMMFSCLIRWAGKLPGLERGSRRGSKPPGC